MTRSTPATWHILTGEYPPQAGGIADYSALIAAAIASTGRVVHVWTSSTGDSPSAPGVTVHRSAGRWSRRDLLRLGEELDRFEPGRHLLIQYAPNLYGRKGMNLGFCRWLVARAGLGDQVSTMFHEVQYLPGPGDSRPIRRLLPIVQRPMARRLLRASSRVFVSTPRWADLLATIDPNRGHDATWLPVPSTIPVVDDPAGVASTRRRIVGDDRPLIGSFGTFANAAGTLLAGLLPGILEDDPVRMALLIGRNGGAFAARLVADHPSLEGRLIATGDLEPPEISRHLQVCDLLAQPYPDGVCGRRSTAMAGLAHGVAIVSNRGDFTESDWSGAVALVEGPDLFRREVSRLLADPASRARLGMSGRATYQRRFSVERTVETLLDG